MRKVIRLEAMPGEVLDDCIFEAISMSVKENCNVELKHNGRIYNARPNEFYTNVLNTELRETKK